MQDKFNTKDRHIAMPNEIFTDMKQWILNGDVQSKHHLEFIYSYYWLVAYVWRYAKYAEMELTQHWFKKALGYNPNEKRLNYIIKKDGLLDQKDYTESTTDYPVSWSLLEGELTFGMLSDFDTEDQKLFNHFKSNRYTIKAPLKHLGNENEIGIFTDSQNSHSISLAVFEMCMNNPNLKCAGFFMYGILRYIQDKSIHFNKSDVFECGNDVLVKASAWDRKKVIAVTEELQAIGLIKKTQESKFKGIRNIYHVF